MRLISALWHVIYLCQWVLKQVMPLNNSFKHWSQSCDYNQSPKPILVLALYKTRTLSHICRSYLSCLAGIN